MDSDTNEQQQWKGVLQRQVHTFSDMLFAILHTSLALMFTSSP